MAKNNGATINAVEKRELAKIIEAEFNDIISNMKQEIKFTEGEILEQAEKKFGLKCIDLEIKQLKKKIETLENQKQSMGFDKYGNGFSKKWEDSNHVVDPNTKAGRFYYMKVARNVDIKALENERNSRLKSLWLMDQRTDVKQLTESKVEIKCLPKPKKK